MLRAATLALLFALPAAAQNAEAQRALARYTELRPADQDLSMYRLDWAPDLGEAQKRALREKRPVLLIVIHAKYGDLITGHC